MSKKIFATLALALVVLAGTVSAQEPTSSRAAIEKAMQSYLAQVKPELRSREDIVPKAVPRTDKAEATFIGTVLLVDDTDFLDDGTPFRLVAVDSNRPIDQFHFIFCLGSSFERACGRLIEGRRVQFTADVLTIDEGDDAGLALFVASRIRT